MHASRLRAWNRSLTREHGKGQIIYSSEHVALFVVARDASEPGVCVWTSGEHLHLMAWLSFETRRHSITQKQSAAKSCQFSVMQACSHLASLAAALKIKSADIALSLVVLCFAFICLCLFMLNFSPISCRLFLMVFMQCCALRAQPVTQHAARQSVVLVFFFFLKKALQLWCD